MPTNIEWTDETWNPTTGCTKVSPGCAHCYIERTPAFRIAGRRFDRKGHIPLQLHDDRLDRPLHWRKPRRVFVDSLSDLFHDDVPFDVLDQVFNTMLRTPQHQYQVLTKRPQRMQRYVCSRGQMITLARGPVRQFDNSEVLNWPPKNAWLGVSVENQHFADERIPLLLETPAAVRFISAEPLLEAVDLTGLFAAHFENPASDAVLDWVIVGGESGPGARRFDLDWARSIVAQCQAAGVPVFVKQVGSNAIWAGTPLVAYDVKDRKGGDPLEWPADLRVREFPEARA